MNNINECKAGDRVQLGPNVRHKEFAGLPGTVKKTVKSRNMVVVICDNGKEYGAFPKNVDHIAAQAIIADHSVTLK